MFGMATEENPPVRFEGEERDEETEYWVTSHEAREIGMDNRGSASSAGGSQASCRAGFTTWVSRIENSARKVAQD